MKRFLIINPFGIGDVLFTTPVIRAIKDNFPDSFIGYWCNERVQDILKNNKDIDVIFPLSRGDMKRISGQSKIEGLFRFLSLVRKLKKGKFDVTIDFSLDHRYSLISKIIGIRKRVGFNYKKRGRFLTDSIELEGYSSKHAVEYYLDLLNFLGLKPKKYDLNLAPTPESKARANSILGRSGINEGDLLIGIAPGAGASWGKDASFKHWPPAKFARLADRMVTELKAKVLIIGSEAEKEIAEAMVYSMKNKPVNLAGRTNLEDSIAVINNLRILVANDGGLLHIACALGVNTVSIFGPVDELVYGPYSISEKHAVIKRNIECRPCYKNFKRAVCDRDRECLNLISIDEVFEAVRGLL
ncbi:MAG: lipopolysaccharide heptosyltransferase II [Candidatus Omnitrophica bacterium]|nr:lipopolysaccharide heptosyltransferase II [Candidatus Omnitrophota bacterium]